MGVTATETTHTHGLIDPTIKRSRSGLRASALALLVLGLTAAAQAGVFVISGSIALLADLIHNVGDAATAIPLGAAFALRSVRAEQLAGFAVVLAILVSAFVAGYEAIDRLIHPHNVEAVGALAATGLLGVGGNWWAARIRTQAGRSLGSPALIADGNHARTDAYVSLGVVTSAVAVAAGLQIADPLIGLAITAVIARVAWQSWQTVRQYGDHLAARAPSRRESSYAGRVGWRERDHVPAAGVWCEEAGERAGRRLAAHVGRVPGVVEEVGVDVEGGAHAGVAEDPADLHDVESEVYDQVAGERVSQVVEPQSHRSIFKFCETRGAAERPTLGVALAQRRSATGREHPIVAAVER